MGIGLSLYFGISRKPMVRYMAMAAVSHAQRVEAEGAVASSAGRADDGFGQATSESGAADTGSGGHRGVSSHRPRGRAAAARRRRLRGRAGSGRTCRAALRELFIEALETEINAEFRLVLAEEGADLIDVGGGGRPDHGSLVEPIRCRHRCGACALRPSADRPDDERLAVGKHVASGEDALLRRLVVGSGFDVAAVIEFHGELVEEAVLDGSDETHGEQDEVDVQGELAALDGLEPGRSGPTLNAVEFRDIAIGIAGEAGGGNAPFALAAFFVRELSTRAAA